MNTPRVSNDFYKGLFHALPISISLWIIIIFAIKMIFFK
jgi:hypothetical protein